MACAHGKCIPIIKIRSEIVYIDIVVYIHIIHRRTCHEIRNLQATYQTYFKIKIYTQQLQQQQQNMKLNE